MYAYAPLLHALGGHIVSCDDMTGIQALERSAPTQPMQPGRWNGASLSTSAMAR